MDYAATWSIIFLPGGKNAIWNDIGNSGTTRRIKWIVVSVAPKVPYWYAVKVSPAMAGTKMPWNLLIVPQKKPAKARCLFLNMNKQALTFH